VNITPLTRNPSREFAEDVVERPPGSHHRDAGTPRSIPSTIRTRGVVSISSLCLGASVVESLRYDHQYSPLGLWHVQPEPTSSARLPCRFAERVFRDQHFDDDTQLAFSRNFGESEISLGGDMRRLTIRGDSVTAARQEAA
jgi:hypothetical protein